MASTTYGNPDLIRKNLFKAVKTYDESIREPNYLNLAGREIPTEQAYEIAALYSGLGLPQVTPEYGVVPNDRVYQVARKQYTYQKRTLQVQFSDELFINEQPGYGIVRSYGTLLKSSFQQAKEIAAAIYMNGANSTSLIQTPQGIALASTAHPLETGTDASTFTTAFTLGPIAIEDAMMGLKMQKAHKGYSKAVYAPFQLEVHPANEMAAKRYVQSTNGFAGTNNNDMNTLKGTISKIVSVPQFTNTGWWAIRAVDLNVQPRVLINRYGFKTSGEPFFDQDTDSWKVTAKEAYLFDVFDYRGVWYSLAS